MWPRRPAPSHPHATGSAHSGDLEDRLVLVVPVVVSGEISDLDAPCRGHGSEGYRRRQGGRNIDYDAIDPDTLSQAGDGLGNAAGVVHDHPAEAEIICSSTSVTAASSSTIITRSPARWGELRIYIFDIPDGPNPDYRE
jgi:hypothetical protein